MTSSFAGRPRLRSTEASGDGAVGAYEGARGPVADETMILDEQVPVPADHRAHVRRREHGCGLLHS